MFEEINKELRRLQEGIDRWHRADNMLKELYSQLRQQEEKKVHFENRLRKENLDVEKLSRMSLIALFYTILGSREKQLEKERQEALAAELKYNDILRQIDYINIKISELEAERSRYSNYQKEYDQLFRKKYEMLKNSNSANAEKIIQLERDISKNHTDLKEILEAISAGNRVLNALDRVARSLDRAESWGMWDMFGSSGLLTNMAKHGHIDDARDAASEVQSLLNTFRAELADVQITSQISIDISGFTKFADFFFDGLITDWIVQRKIHDSQNSVMEVRDQVNRVMHRLRDMEYKTNNEINSLKNKLNEIVSKA
ncbi:MAG: hypothetical protein GX187_09185 [Clostridiaceae bacterium]|nr:hypothetical protein [Clostridiaceae bacterium]